MKKVCIVFIMYINLQTMFAYNFYVPPFGYGEAGSFSKAADLQVKNSANEFIFLAHFLILAEYNPFDFSITIESGFSNIGVLGSVKFLFSTDDMNIGLEKLLVNILADTLRENDIPIDSVKIYAPDIGGPSRKGMINPENDDLHSCLFSYTHSEEKAINEVEFIFMNNSIYGEDYNKLKHTWPQKSHTL